jgi:hypothetical protein
MKFLNSDYMFSLPIGFREEEHCQISLCSSGVFFPSPSPAATIHTPHCPPSTGESPLKGIRNDVLIEGHL